MNERLQKEIDKIKRKLQAFLVILDNADVDYLIAGGFPRDLHFGKIPKDIDIFVEATYSNLTAVADLLRDIDVNYVTYGDDEESGYNACLSEDVKDIVKTRVMGIEVDFIFVDLTKCSDTAYDGIVYKEPIVRYVVKRFDANINKFCYDTKKGEPVYIGDKIPTELVIRDINILTPERIYKLFDKALEFGLNTDKANQQYKAYKEKKDEEST